MLVRFLRAPVDDYLAALDRVFGAARVLPVLVVLLALAGSWLVYVPIHELLHAYGCIWTGGEVTRLEIDAIYGAALLARVFPFVVVGSAYAGQLTGFDTGGSDLVYLATVFAPFLLTIAVGVPLLCSAARERRPYAAAAKLGVAIPVAFAPAISLPGDFYEIGSILVSRVATWLYPSFDPARWRSDDVVRLAAELPGGWSVGDALGIPAGFLVGALLGLATYHAGRWLYGHFAGRIPSHPAP